MTFSPYSKEREVPQMGEEFDSRTVLILEDYPPCLDYIKYIVGKKLGLSYVSAKTGRSALQILKGKTVDCMLIDISLGKDMSGIQFMKRVKRINRLKEVPQIAVTAHTGKGQRERMLGHGFDDYIAKPLSPKLFSKVLSRNLAF